MRKLVRHIPNAFYVVARFSLQFFARAVEFLAANAKTSPADDEGRTFIGGRGVLNFRTGKFDDGTDPAGMYDLE